MAKETRLKEAFLRYQEEEKWEYPDAFHLWTLGLDWYEIARAIQKRHGLEDDERAIANRLEKEAQELGLGSPGAKMEDSDREVAAAINGFFDQYFGSHFAKEIVRNRMKRLSKEAKDLLDFLLQTEGTLKTEGRISRTDHQMDDIKLAYKHIYKRELTSEVIDELVNAGIINQHASYSRKYPVYQWVASRYALPHLK
ncbi:MAG: hypothetical protein ISS53_03445 [Dehalococcoidia bacterium]|nr:hypothetical protein [Dehalococcoidia bacterium]